MPMYSFVCPKCGSGRQVVRPMSQSDEPVSCGKIDCIGWMDRDYKTDMFHTSKDHYDKPIVSDAMAVSIDQIPEHRKLFPDVKITDEGQPIMENYAQHENYLEKTGQIKHPAKTRGGKRIKSVK